GLHRRRAPTRRSERRSGRPDPRSGRPPFPRPWESAHYRPEVRVCPKRPRAEAGDVRGGGSWDDCPRTGTLIGPGRARRPRDGEGRMEVLDSFLDAVGETPLVRLNAVTLGLQATVLAKLEMLNP